jgi:copper(I)-binding protein
MKKILVLALMLLYATSIWAADKKPYEFEDAFVRATPMKMSAGYVVIKNDSNEKDVLLSASASWAGKIELHEIVENKGVVEMREVKEMALSAHGTLALRPNGLHLMLFDLDKPLVAGKTAKLTFHFAKAGDVTVKFRVMPVSYKGK